MDRLFFLMATFSLLDGLLRCRHAHWKESYYDLRADEPNGPRTWHGIRWTCSRCHTISRASGH